MPKALRVLETRNCLSISLALSGCGCSGKWPVKISGASVLRPAAQAGQLLTYKDQGGKWKLVVSTFNYQIGERMGSKKLTFLQLPPTGRRKKAEALGHPEELQFCNTLQQRLLQRQ